MQTVPSLVGTGTAIAAAASGLVFGQRTDIPSSSATAPRPRSHRRRSSIDREPSSNSHHSRLGTFAFSRPSTSNDAPSSTSHETPHYHTLPRPATASRPPLSRYGRPQGGQFTPPKTVVTPPKTTTGRKQSFVRRGDSPAPIPEAPRDSISSNGSWIRRLSIRPLSHHGSSPRSSIGPDTHSIALSQGSSAPFLPSERSAPSLPPNKLVKRPPSQQYDDSLGVYRRRSKSHLPTLRRPTTSHQRSATLQQQFQPDSNLTSRASPAPSPKFSFDDHPQPHEFTAPPSTPDRTPGRAERKSVWASFFHSKRSSVSGRSSSGRFGELNPHSRPGTAKRIVVGDSGDDLRVHLVKPRMVSTASAPPKLMHQRDEETEEEKIASPLVHRQNDQVQSQSQSQSQIQIQPQPEPESVATSPDVTPSRRPRKSISMPFASAAGSWVSRTSGSLRRPKQRGTATAAAHAYAHAQTSSSSGHARAEPRMAIGNKRYASDPMAGAQSGAAGRANTPLESTMLAPGQQGSALGSAAMAQLRTRKRNSSSPLPPLSRLSSFNVDMSRLGSSGGASSTGTHHQQGVVYHHNLQHQHQILQVPGQGQVHVQVPVPVPVRSNQPSGSSTSSAALSQLHAHGLKAPSSTMESSEGDTRDFTSGDDDDTDFKSDTMFDSLRTVASARARAVETPLESMYDESPPSTAGNGNGTKTKRLSIQEILGRSWEEDDNRIMEEDESVSTPVRTAKRSDAATAHMRRELQPGPRFSIDSAPNDINKDLSRMSMDDDFDDDWARDDDDAPCNPLSPPSKGSSLNSKGINPNVRLALASISGNGTLESSNTNGAAANTERPLSNIFDWSEPSHEKYDTTNGKSPRPKTAYAKQEMDSRGGRSAIRKGPTPTHVRSQSVPVVHDNSDDTKTTGAKYGTWGTGNKTVSEDWDDDFEFGGGSFGNGDRDDKAFAVPESIRATQPSVKAHSGQIRELSLLVNDLKRLCRHGRDLDLMDGAHKGLWKEAEGIIALASPDEDEDDEAHSESTASTSSINFDAFDIDESFGDDGFDAHSMDRLDAAFDGHEPPMSKTTVVRERHSPRRRSVFMPEDDIFGSWPVSDGNATQTSRSSRPRTPENRSPKSKDVNGVVRSVMEAMHRSPSENVPHHDGKMHFDTNSLRALVKRASDLRDMLSDMVRRVDQITQSPVRTPRHERQLESSPAFTRVFDDPGSSPPRRILRSRGNTSIMEKASPGNSPSSSLPQRIHMMTVS